MVTWFHSSNVSRTLKVKTHFHLIRVGKRMDANLIVRFLQQMKVVWHGCHYSLSWAMQSSLFVPKSAWGPRLPFDMSCNETSLGLHVNSNGANAAANPIWNPGPVMKRCSCHPWTHWGRDKMADISQTTLSNAFSWMKKYKFRFIFHWILFPKGQLTICQHCFR